MKHKFANTFYFLLAFCVAITIFCLTPVYARTVLHEDSNVSITYNGISRESYGGGYDINLIVENFSNRSIAVMVDEMSINGYMASPDCYINVSPGKKQ